MVSRGIGLVADTNHGYPILHRTAPFPSITSEGFLRQVIGATFLSRKRDYRTAKAWLWDLGIAIGASALTLALRVLIELAVADVIKFPLVYPALAAATLLASWRAGLIVILICQTLIWYFLLPYPDSFRFASLSDVVSLVLATVAQLILLVIVHAYQKSRSRELELEALRLADLEMAMDELDHRTMNNFQLAMAILRSQASRSSSDETHAALDTAVGRLSVLASVHGKLQVKGTKLGSRPLATLLDNVLAGARAHAADLHDVKIDAELEELEVPAEHALRVGLIVNELVTNSLKYAFPEGKGRVRVMLWSVGEGYVVRVGDNGIGSPAEKKPGTGSRLLPMLAKSIGAELVALPGPGTTNELRVNAIIARKPASRQ